MPLLFERPGSWRCELTDRGIFFVQILGEVREGHVLDQFMEEARPHLERLQPVLYMNDAQHVQEAPLAMQWRLASHMKNNAKYIAKSGVFGLTPRKMFMVRTMVRASGRQNLRVFESRAACEAWLLEGRPGRDVSSGGPSDRPPADPPS